MTLPSHATMFTGLRPPSHGVRTNDGFRLPDDVPTLAESLRAAGYRTAAFVAAAPLRRAAGLARGFEIYDDEFLATRSERRAGEVVDAAAAWLRGRAADSVFLWVHLFDPHTPYSAPAEHAHRHPGEPYDSEVEYTDHEVGRLLDVTRELGLYDDALIVITADHGESLGEHGERTHGTFLYDATIRVPLMIRTPGAPARFVAAPVELTDLAPTIAAAARARMSRTDGIDLQPLIAGNPGDLERAAYAESYYQNVLLGWSPLRAARTARWKFIDAPTRELYDLAADPAEAQNLNSSRSSLASDLASALPRAVPAGSRESGATAEPARAEAEERLRSLGYLSGRTSASSSTGTDPKDRVDLWAHLEQAIELTSSDPPAAERALKRALAMEPFNGLALKYLGDLHYRAGRYDDAAVQYRAAIEAGFEHPDAFLNLGAAALRLGDAGAARKALERGLELEPGAADGWNQLGAVHASAGRHEAARRALERAIALQPGAAEPRYNLAVVARTEGRHDEAMRLLDEALARRADYPEALVERGNGLFAQRRHEAALDSYRAALSKQADDPQALFGAARASAALRLDADARRHYERFLRVAPADLGSHRAAARRELARLGGPSPAPKR